MLQAATPALILASAVHAAGAVLRGGRAALRAARRPRIDEAAVKARAQAEGARPRRGRAGLAGLRRAAHRAIRTRW